MSLSASASIDLSDHEAVLALLSYKDQMLAEKDAQLTAQEQKLSSHELEIVHLKLQIEKMRHDKYGASSEKHDRNLDQLEFKLEELESQQAASSVAAPVSSVALVKSKPVRQTLPDHLKREVITLTPAEDRCPDCGGKLSRLGEDVSEYLERIPETFKVIRHVRVKMSCNGCDKIVQPAAPSRPIERCLAGPALLAHVLTAKYANHIPLNRQSEIYAREGVELDRSTLAGWVGASSQMLAPLVEALRRHVMAAAKIHADDTPVPVLAPGRGRTRTGLKDFRGILQADAYAGFGHLYGTGNIHEAACMAHARRKFHDIHEVQPSPITTEALDRIGALYSIEREIRGQTAEQRQEVRQARAKPLLDELRRWLEQRLTTLSTKSDTSGAIRYALARWRALLRYLEDGLLEIGRVEMWRGGVGLAYLYPALSVAGASLS
jgi:transposase